MVVATHNPSNVAMQTLEILVPHSNWKVQKLDTEQSSKWVNTEANVLCNQQQVEFHPELNETQCRMYVRQQISGGQIGFTKLIYDASIDLEEDVCQTPIKPFIGTKDLTLQYQTTSSDGKAYFDLIDVNAGEREEVSLSLNYWQGFSGVTAEQNSGAYIFRPMEGQYEPYLYSQPSSVSAKQCRVKDQMTIHFTGID